MNPGNIFFIFEAVPQVGLTMPGPAGRELAGYVAFYSGRKLFEQEAYIFTLPRLSRKPLNLEEDISWH